MTYALFLLNQTKFNLLSEIDRVENEMKEAQERANDCQTHINELLINLEDVEKAINTIGYGEDNNGEDPTEDS